MTRVFIAFAGLPGSGKSTLAQHVARELKAVPLLEPEEDQWPQYVRDRNPVAGAFTALTWFRAQRVPLYHRALVLRSQGRIAVLDSYYDKLCHRWLGAPELRWLIERTDPYFEVASAMAATDAARLPSADLIVALTISEDHWRRQLAQRGRAIDRNAGFLSSFPSQATIVRAAHDQAHADGSMLVEHQRREADPAIEAVELAAAIGKARGV